MRADEDFNEFNSWDSGGAAGLIAAVPAVMYYVFSEHDLKGTGVLLAMAAGAAVLVFLVAHFTRSRVVGRLVQLVGVVLCVAYWGYAFHMWATHNRISLPQAAEQPAAAEAASAPAAAVGGGVIGQGPPAALPGQGE